jgi:hypothetical protein
MLHADATAVIARAPVMEPADRKIAVEIALALAWNVAPPPVEQILGQGRGT